MAFPILCTILKQLGGGVRMVEEDWIPSHFRYPENTKYNVVITFLSGNNEKNLE
jgi:hypothetical protein